MAHVVQVGTGSHRPDSTHALVPSRPCSTVVILCFKAHCHIYSLQNAVETCHGDNFASAAAAVSQSPQVIAVGVNCLAPQYVEVSALCLLT